MSKEEFYLYLKDNLNIELSDMQKDQLEKFAKLLIEYNEHTNITAITEIDDIYLKHFYDSLTLVLATDLTKKLNILDIGSGGGFPGIVLKIVFPYLNITSVDGNHKKTDFQNYIIDNLGLTGIEVINERAEIYYKTGNRYDLVVARAVADLTVLSELCIPFVKNGSFFIAMKGNAIEEVNEAGYAIDKMGGLLKPLITFKLPISGDSRCLIVIEKVNDTPEGYPRVYDKILKKPLK